MCSCNIKVLQESLLYSRAFWVTKSTIAWDVDAGDGSCYLYGSKTANLSVANGEIQGFVRTVVTLGNILFIYGVGALIISAYHIGYDVKIDLGKSNNKLPEHVSYLVCLSICRFTHSSVIKL